MNVLCRTIVVFGGLIGVGCGSEPPTVAANKAPETPAAGSIPFDPASCGVLKGRVLWDSPVPEVTAFPAPIFKPDGKHETKFFPNPHHPKVHPGTKGLADAVVFLRGLPAGTSKPWDLPDVSVEMIDRGIQIRQGTGPSRRVGFVRRGAEVAMLSKEPVFHNLRARGAAFFSLAFPDPEKPLRRTFEQNGLVHLSSGAGMYWVSAYLFVDDSPYYALTDSEGRFTLDRVPEGPVEIAAWHPNRKYSHQIRDPETSAVSRQTWGEPLQVVKTVQVKRGESTTLDFSVSE